MINGEEMRSKKEDKREEDTWKRLPAVLGLTAWHRLPFDLTQKFHSVDVKEAVEGR